MKLSHMYATLPTSEPWERNPESIKTFEYYRMRYKYFFFLIILLLASSVTGTVSYWIGRKTISLEECSRRLSTWSPLLDVIEYQQSIFNAGFTTPSIYRGEPRPELEQAWMRITRNGAGSIRVPSGELHRLNKSATRDVLGFPGEQDQDVHDAKSLLEVFHQLHCLNEIRKMTWPGYYPPSTDEEYHRNHLDHCVEILRISLMCTSDVTPIIANFQPNMTSATPDFYTLHTCRNFERIMDYVIDHENV